MSVRRQKGEVFVQDMKTGFSTVIDSVITTENTSTCYREEKQGTTGHRGRKAKSIE